MLNPRKIIMIISLFLFIGCSDKNVVINKTKEQLANNYLRTLSQWDYKNIKQFYKDHSYENFFKLLEQNNETLQKRAQLIELLKRKFHLSDLELSKIPDTDILEDYRNKNELKIDFTQNSANNYDMTISNGANKISTVKIQEIHANWFISSKIPQNIGYNIYINVLKKQAYIFNRLIRLLDDLSNNKKEVRLILESKFGIKTQALKC